MRTPDSYSQHGCAPLKYNGRGRDNLFINNVCEGAPGLDEWEDGSGFELVNFRTDRKGISAETFGVDDIAAGATGEDKDIELRGNNRFKVGDNDQIFFYRGRTSQLPAADWEDSLIDGNPQLIGTPFRARSVTNGLEDEFYLEDMDGKAIQFTSVGSGDDNVYSRIEAPISYKVENGWIRVKKGRIQTDSSGFTGLPFPIFFVGAGVPPEPLELNVRYYIKELEDVENSNDVRFKVSLVPFGAAEDLTTEGDLLPGILRSTPVASRYEYSRHETDPVGNPSRIFLEGHGLEDGDQVVFLDSKTGPKNDPDFIPKNLKAKTAYFVTSVDTSENGVDSFGLRDSNGNILSDFGELDGEVSAEERRLPLISVFPKVDDIFPFGAPSLFKTDDVTNRIVCKNHGYANGAPVMFLSLGGQLPAVYGPHDPLRFGAVYYVRNAEDNSFQISADYAANSPVINIMQKHDSTIGVNQLLPYELALMENYFLGYGNAFAAYTDQPLIDHRAVVSDFNHWYYTGNPRGGDPIIRGESNKNWLIDQWKSNGEDNSSLLFSKATEDGFDIEAKAVANGVNVP